MHRRSRLPPNSGTQKACAWLVAGGIIHAIIDATDDNDPDGNDPDGNRSIDRRPREGRAVPLA